MSTSNSAKGRRPPPNTRILIAVAALVVVAIVLAALWLFVWGSGEPMRADATDAQLVRRGEVQYKLHCASCHGANLEGQPNWRERDENGFLPAPPHDVTGHTWHHTDALLFDVTKYGSTAVVGSDYKSNMPGFEDKMSDGEIWAVLAFIKSTWPADIQEIQSELEDTRQR
ncbi:MAG: cytochrome c [Chloroflexota bacterium]|nr:cytochrome c [Chloroflexota bacterium]MDE2931476.1 cytochrome c [Chloroflexota bacterium]